MLKTEWFIIITIFELMQVGYGMPLAYGHILEKTIAKSFGRTATTSTAVEALLHRRRKR